MFHGVRSAFKPESIVIEPSDSIFDDIRPLPFVVKVAAEWLNFDDAADIDDGAFFFRDRSRLTGVLGITSDGADVNFSDIGINE